VNNNEVSQTNAASAAEDPAVTPESVVEQLRALRSQIPNYGQLPVRAAQSLRRVSSIDPEFGQAAIQAVSASPTVQSTVGQTAEELQTATEAAARWSMVRDELKATLDGVASAVLTMKHTIGQSLLLTYAVSKKLVKMPQHADLLPHVALMRKTNRRGHSRKTQPPAPVPTPKAEGASEPSSTPVV
jgi:ABC-type transporter Mla subunit MlaD